MILAIGSMSICAAAQTLGDDAAPSTNVPSPAHGLATCDDLYSALPEDVLVWMSDGNTFEKNADKLGWRSWQALKEDAMGYPGPAGDELLLSARPEHIWWQAVDMTGDGIVDRVVIGSIGQGHVSRRYYVNYVFLYCGLVPDPTGPASFEPCGNLTYRGSALRINEIDTRYEVELLRSDAQGTHAAFSILERDNERLLLKSVIPHWDADYDLAADLWRLNRDARTRLLACSWTETPTERAE